jgi:hypothetical protein
MLLLFHKKRKAISLTGECSSGGNISQYRGRVRKRNYSLSFQIIVTVDFLNYV